MTLKQLEFAIRKLPATTQQKLLQELPRLLKLHPADFFLLKASEKSFDFWNNREDSVYDTL